MVEDRVTCAVANCVVRVFTDWLRCRGPDFSIFIVAKIDALACRISNGIILPGCETIEIAVPCPAHSSSRLAHDKAADSVADDIHPRSRRKILSRKMNLVFVVRIESTDSVEVRKLAPRLLFFFSRCWSCLFLSQTRFDIDRRWLGRRRNSIDGSLFCRCVNRRNLASREVLILDIRELEEVAETKAVAIHLNSGDGVKQCNVVWLQNV